MKKNKLSHNTISNKIKSGKYKDAIFYAGALEGESRQIELEAILQKCLSAGRIKDAVCSAKMMGRILRPGEVDSLFAALTKCDGPNLLKTLRQTDNLPPPKELAIIFEPLKEISEDGKAFLQRLTQRKAC